MPLFNVKFKFNTVVKAANPDQARQLAWEQREEIVKEDLHKHLDGVCEALQIGSIYHLPLHWNVTCIPWGVQVRPAYTLEEDLNE